MSYRYERPEEKDHRLKMERSDFHGVMCKVAEGLKDGEYLMTSHGEWAGPLAPQDFTFCVSQGEGEPEVRVDISRRYIGVNPFLQISPGGWCRRWEKKRLSLKKASFDPWEFLVLIRSVLTQRIETETAEATSRRLNQERIAEATAALGFKTDEYRFTTDERGNSPFDRVTSHRRLDGALDYTVSLVNHRLTANGVKRLDALLREELAQPRSEIVRGAVSQRPHPDCTCFECASCHTPTVCAACLICTCCSHHMPGCHGCPAAYGNLPPIDHITNRTAQLNYVAQGVDADKLLGYKG